MNVSYFISPQVRKEVACFRLYVSMLMTGLATNSQQTDCRDPKRNTVFYSAACQVPMALVSLHFLQIQEKNTLFFFLSFWVILYLPSRQREKKPCDARNCCYRHLGTFFMSISNFFS
jgi:hypothetical protein